MVGPRGRSRVAFKRRRLDIVEGTKERGDDRLHQGVILAVEGRDVDVRSRPPAAQRVLLQIRREVHRPRRSDGRTARRGTPRRREREVGVVVVVCAQGDLLEVVQAFRPGGRRADFLHRRQQQADQNGNDCDHDQEFNEGKPSPPLSRQAW